MDLMSFLSKTWPRSIFVFVASRRLRSRLFSFDPDPHASRALKMSRIGMVRSSRAVRLMITIVKGSGPGLYAFSPLRNTAPSVERNY
jgi:hypothetical protein